MASYDAVCFDLDSTLCVSTQDREALLSTAFDQAGCDPFCTPGELRAVVPDLPTTQTDREFYESLFELAARRADADPTLAPELADAYQTAYDPTAVRFRPGAEAALDIARERAAVGLVTNGSRPTQTQKLQSLGITDAFDVAVFVDPANGVLPKPNAAPFERALSELTAEPADAIHVGDSLHADIAGANAMGMDSAWLPPERSVMGHHEPTYELDSLDALDGIV